MRRHVIEQDETDEDETTPPAYDDGEEYKATKMLRVGKMALELWFVKADGKGEQIFPLADMRRMEPPGDPQKEVAYVYFSGVRVELHGSHLRQVLKAICTHRCTELHEIRPGQKRPPAGQPVIERIYFGDLTRAKPVAADALN